MTSMTTTSPATPRTTTSPSRLRLLALDVRDEMRLLRREPAALFFSVIMPVAFYALFVAMFGGEAAEGSSRPVGTLMLTTFGTYGAIIAPMMNPGIGRAEDRRTGWLEVRSVSPVPIGVSLAAKSVATVPFVVGILIAMTGASATLGVLQITLVEWSLLMAALVVGSQSFALLGLAVGALASPNATTAILNAIVIPISIASGLWFPLEALPAWVTGVAPWLPTYHLAQLAAVPLEGGPWLHHLGVLIAFTAGTGLLAALAWRRSTQ